jgi:hypothetical protein
MLRLGMSLARHNPEPKINTAEVVSAIQSGRSMVPKTERGPDLSPHPPNPQ